MIFVNNMSGKTVRAKSVMEQFVRILSPFAPHIAEELWQKLGHEKSLAHEPWPDCDEAMLVESELPEARYWQIQLCDAWFRSFDYITRQTGLNSAQAHIGADAKLRCLIAHRDPGIPNWLDTCGHPEGMIQYRWIWTKTKPLPEVRMLPFDAVREALPSDTPHVSPAERRRAIAIRRCHIQRREPVS